MRVLITGSRDWTDAEVIQQVLFSLFRISELPPTIIHGGAKGADSVAAQFCRAWHWPLEEYKADWQRYGKSAGIRRNIEMLDSKPDLVLAFRIGGEKSRGTTHCIRAAQERGIPVITYDLPS